MTENVALDEGELAPLEVKAGDPQPQAVIYVHDVEHQRSFIGVREPGQHRYRYLPDVDSATESE